MCENFKFLRLLYDVQFAISTCCTYKISLRRTNNVRRERLHIQYIVCSHCAFVANVTAAEFVKLQNFRQSPDLPMIQFEKKLFRFINH